MSTRCAARAVAGRTERQRLGGARSSQHVAPFALRRRRDGAAAALIAAAAQPTRVRAIVSRGGRPDLAGETLSAVRTPTLLIVGSADTQVLRLNEMAMGRIPAQTQLVIIPGATHLFEETGALELVAQHAAAWFKLRLGSEIGNGGR
jgi:putative phosphoribosyl transferase